jgi:hypothetical protein
MSVAPFVALMAVGFLLACAPPVMGPFTVFADPGKYEYFTCEQLLPERKRAADRELELKLLMDRAERGAGGAFVNVIAYESDYITAREELKLIDATARDKKCVTLDQSSPAIR